MIVQHRRVGVRGESVVPAAQSPRVSSPTSVSYARPEPSRNIGLAGQRTSQFLALVEQIRVDRWDQVAHRRKGSYAYLERCRCRRRHRGRHRHRSGRLSGSRRRRTRNATNAMPAAVAEQYAIRVPSIGTSKPVEADSNAASEPDSDPDQNPRFASSGPSRFGCVGTVPPPSRPPDGPEVLRRGRTSLAYERPSRHPRFWRCARSGQ